MGELVALALLPNQKIYKLSGIRNFYLAFHIINLDSSLFLVVKL